MKKLISIILSVSIFFVLSSCGFAAENLDFTMTMQIDNPVMTVNGTQQEIDPGRGTAPVIVNERTLVPIRAIIEAMGGTVEWNGDTQTASLTYGDDEIRLTIDSATAYLNDTANTLDTAPAIINERTMLPIRFIAESFRFSVDWNENEQLITITKAADEPVATAAPTAAPADKDSGNNTENKEENKMAELLYQGHASFRLTTGEGKVIYIDPYAGEGYDKEADLILVTHQHPDHNKIDLVPQSDGCVIFQNSDAITDDGYKTLDFAGVHIEPVQAYNQNHDVKQCVGYLVTVNGKTLYFAGDTSKTDQMAELKDKNIEYAFLPIDGHFNMDIPEAVECAELIGAKHTVPIHMSPGELFNRERAEQFVTPSAMIVEAGEVIELFTL